ncbi:hypothetical protein ACMHYB_02140 [Sorangium sp. So ce1128]
MTLPVIVHAALGGLAGLLLLGSQVSSALLFVVVQGAMESS